MGCCPWMFINHVNMEERQIWLWSNFDGKPRTGNWQNTQVTIQIMYWLFVGKNMLDQQLESYCKLINFYYDRQFVTTLCNKSKIKVILKPERNTINIDDECQKQIYITHIKMCWCCSAKKYVFVYISELMINRFFFNNVNCKRNG